MTDCAGPNSQHKTLVVFMLPASQNRSVDVALSAPVPTQSAVPSYAEQHRGRLETPSVEQKLRTQTHQRLVRDY